MNKRYFIVSYYFSKSGNTGHGDSHVITNGHFMNRDKYASEMKRDYNFDDLVITFILEINHSDFLDYNNNI